MVSVGEGGLQGTAPLQRVEFILEQADILFSESYSEANRIIYEQGRADLAMADPAAMMPITDPAVVITDGNNFAAKFVMYTERRNVLMDAEDQPETDPVPITAEELLRLREMPKVESYEGYMEARDSGRYPGLRGSDLTHRTKPAFQRMLLLLPLFTKNLVVGMSALENRGQAEKFEPELFAAYQVMSRLVDTSDLFVVRDGQVDDQYLTR